MKPLLAQREKRILMIVIPLQVCSEVAIVILDEYTPASRSRLILLLSSHTCFFYTPLEKDDFRCIRQNY